MSDLVSITARLNAAKPGPWTIGAVGLMRDRERICAPTGSNGGYFGFIDAPRFDDDRPDVTRMTRPDAEFIAHAPSDIGYLLGRVTELEAQRDAVLALHRRGMIYTSGSTDPKHKPSTEFRCTDDHLLWPCATVTALGGEPE